jgi:hypothetical protein
MIRTLAIAAAIAGGTMLALPAAAAPLAPASGAVAAAEGSSDLVHTVQWRRYGYGPRYYGYRRGPAVGAGIAAGIIGGALAAGALAAPPPPVYVYPEPAPIYVAPPVYAAPVPRAYGYSVEDTDAVAYCASRFRSYNPQTGTYIAKGGVVRACP